MVRNRRERLYAAGLNRAIGIQDTAPEASCIRKSRYRVVHTNQRISPDLSIRVEEEQGLPLGILEPEVVRARKAKILIRLDETYGFPMSASYNFRPVVRSVVNNNYFVIQPP